MNKKWLIIDTHFHQMFVMTHVTNMTDKLQTLRPLRCWLTVMCHRKRLTEGQLDKIIKIQDCLLFMFANFTHYWENKDFFPQLLPLEIPNLVSCVHQIKHKKPVDFPTFPHNTTQTPRGPKIRSLCLLMFLKYVYSHKTKVWICRKRSWGTFRCELMLSSSLSNS